MYLQTVQSSFRMTMLTLSLLSGLMLLSAASVQAQYPDYGRNDRYGNRGGYGRYGNDMYRVAQQNGYNDGLYKGQEDSRDRDRYNPEKASAYKKATNGYDSYYGNKDAYKQAYRNAFLQGYDEGYNRYGYNNRNNGRYGNRSTKGEILRRILLGY